MPMRNSIRSSSGRTALRSAMSRWMSIAAATASTADENSTSAPSPISLTMRPPWRAMAGSAACLRRSFRRASVPASSRPIRRE
jgi:hypothetical protein